MPFLLLEVTERERAALLLKRREVVTTNTLEGMWDAVARLVVQVAAVRPAEPVVIEPAPPDGDYQAPEFKSQRQNDWRPSVCRTRPQVLKERENAVAGGCCNRFADQMACGCLRDAAPCLECGDSGYAVHPQNGWNRNARRCSLGCAVRCAVCQNPNCDNPDGQH